MDTRRTKLKHPTQLAGLSFLYIIRELTSGTNNSHGMKSLHILWRFAFEPAWYDENHSETIPEGGKPMQIPIELSPDQLARAQQVASQQGYDLNTLIQRWIDRLPAPTPFELPPSPPSTNRTDAARLAVMYKVFSMTPDERCVHHAGVIKQIEEELRKAQSATPQNVGEADWELAAFKQAMNAERRQRGAEPLFDDE